MPVYMNDCFQSISVTRPAFLNVSSWPISVTTESILGDFVIRALHQRNTIPTENGFFI